MVRRWPSARARAAALVPAVAACAMTAGCTALSVEGPDESPSGTPSATSTTASSSATPEPVTLTFAVYGEKERVASYRELARAYTTANPHVTIEIESAPTAVTSRSQIQEHFAEGTAPDVFLAARDGLATLIEQEQLRPVNELLAQRGVEFGDFYHRDGLEAFSEDAALQCMPHDVSPLVVYYNDDLLNLRNLVPPGDEPPIAEDGWSWDQFAEAARSMSRGKVNGVYIRPSLEEMSPFIWSNGGELVDDMQAPTTLTMTDGDTREAVETVLELVRDPRVTPSQTELARQDALTRFIRGRLGMILGPRSLTPRLREAANLDFEVFPLPSLGRFRTAASMNGYCIAATSANVDAAADFIAYAVSDHGSRIVTRAGYIVPSNLQVAHSSAFTQPLQQPENSFVFNEGVRRTQPTPLVPEWAQVVAVTESLWQRAFYAPVIDLDALLAELDHTSQVILGPPPTETPADEE